MALVRCPECAKQISDQAASCPNCGAPRAPSKVDASVGVVTTQATGKAQKGWQVVGVLAIIVGVLMIANGANGAGAAITFAGLVVTIGARISAWWRHG